MPQMQTTSVLVSEAQSMQLSLHKVVIRLFEHNPVTVTVPAAFLRYRACHHQVNEDLRRRAAEFLALWTNEERAFIVERETG